MKAPREYRRCITKLHKIYGKRIPLFCFDNPWMEIKFAKSKKNYKRNKQDKIKMEEFDE